MIETQEAVMTIGNSHKDDKSSSQRESRVVLIIHTFLYISL